MVKKILFTIVIFLFILHISAQNRTNHFINDAQVREQIEKDFDNQKLLTSGRKDKLYDVFSLNLSLEEEEAIKFLYAYMPLSDLADYDGDFFLNRYECQYWQEKHSAGEKPYRKKFFVILFCLTVSIMKTLILHVKYFFTN